MDERLKVRRGLTPERPLQWVLLTLFSFSLIAAAVGLFILFFMLLFNDNPDPLGAVIFWDRAKILFALLFMIPCILGLALFLTYDKLRYLATFCGVLALLFAIGAISQLPIFYGQVDARILVCEAAIDPASVKAIEIPAGCTTQEIDLWFESNSNAYDKKWSFDFNQESGEYRAENIPDQEFTGLIRTSSLPGITRGTWIAFEGGKQEASGEMNWSRTGDVDVDWSMRWEKLDSRNITLVFVKSNAEPVPEASIIINVMSCDRGTTDFSTCEPQKVNPYQPIIDTPSVGDVPPPMVSTDGNRLTFTGLVTGTYRFETGSVFNDYGRYDDRNQMFAAEAKPIPANDLLVHNESTITTETWDDVDVFTVQIAPGTGNLAYTLFWVNEQSRPVEPPGTPVATPAVTPVADLRRASR